MSNERKTLTIGDVVISTDKQTGKYDTTEDGMPTRYHLKVFLPEGTDSVILKSGDYINFRAVDGKDLEKMPDWKKPLVQLRAWIKNQ
jgi:hypothetical protein